MRISDWSSDVCSSDLSSGCSSSWCSSSASRPWSNTSSSTRAGGRTVTDSVSPAPRAEPQTKAPRLLFLVPVAAFVVLAIALAWGLTRDPRALPSALIGKPVPDFALPPVQGRTLGLSSTDLQRSEEHTSELQSLMRISYAVFCVKN